MRPIHLRIFTSLVFAFYSLSASAREFKFVGLKPTAINDHECWERLQTPKKTKKTLLQNERQIVFTTWNPENVVELQGKFKRTGVDKPTGKYQFEPQGEGARSLEEWKFPAKQKKIAQVGQYLGLPGSPLSHFFVAPEVESIEAAEQLFNTGILKDKYSTFLLTGNDSRGINIAFAVRADLDVKIEMETHRSVRWFDPIEGAVARLFTRDLPVMIIRDRESEKPLFILIGTHFKSMRDRAMGRDPHSVLLREAQMAATAQIIKEYQKRFGERIPILLAGDFNVDTRTAEEVAPIKAVLQDAFDILKVPNRTTHTFHPDDDTTFESQLDAIMVSDSVRPFVIGATVLPEFHPETGVRLGNPESLTDRKENYSSDHRAISIVVSGQIFR